MTTTAVLRLLAAAVLLAVPACSTSATPVGEEEPVAIGVLTSLTGPFTPWGIQARAGMQMAAAEINAAGGVGGRRIELVEADDQNSPEEAATALERMVEQDHVVAVGGVISSDVGLAAARTAEELQVPLMLVKAGAGGVLTTESRYTFRTCLPAAPMTAGPLVQHVREQGLTRVGAVIADYAWGQAVRAALEEALAGVEGVELRVEVAPVDEQDFTSYLRSLEAFGPDIIVATGHPPGAGAILLQAGDLGMDVPVTGPYAALATLVEGVGDAAFGRYADFACVDYGSESYQQLARRFAEVTDLGFMESDAVAGYGIVHAVAEAVGAVGDDPSAVAAHLRSGSFEVPGYSFPLEWTEYGELATAAPTLSLIREQAPPGGVNPGADWYPEVLLISEPLEPYVPG